MRTIINIPLSEQVKIKFGKLTDDERMEIMADYCKYCGKDETNEKCYCAPYYDI